MRKKGRELIFLLILIAVFIAFNYDSFNGLVIENYDNREMVWVERVIDGDTVVVNGVSVRMLGINTPERGEKYYAEAKEYTSNLVMNKSIEIERRGKDLYDRDLAYLFDENEEKNINLELVRAGYANAYFPEGKDNYYSQFFEAWEECVTDGKNLCERSLDKCSGCIVVGDFGPDEDLILQNTCSFDCNISGWNIKDEGRKKYEFEEFILKSENQVSVSAKDFNQSYVWTNTGDTMFLRDNKGKLVLWENY